MKIFLIVLFAALLGGCGEKSSVPTPRAAYYEEALPEPPAYTYNVIAEAATLLLDKSPSRVENINIACGAVNGLDILPGGAFSFNAVVGRRTEENGYSDASVIIDGHSEQGCGGGVCQLSSTIYMAASAAGLQIDERHPHSSGVPYAENGMDATVVYGVKDLIFTNNRSGILTLYAQTDGEQVFCKIVEKTLDKET